MRQVGQMRVTVRPCRLSERIRHTLATKLLQIMSAYSRDGRLVTKAAASSSVRKDRELSADSIHVLCLSSSGTRHEYRSWPGQQDVHNAATQTITTAIFGVDTLLLTISGYPPS